MRQSLSLSFERLSNSWPLRGRFHPRDPRPPVPGEASFITGCGRWLCHRGSSQVGRPRRAALPSGGVTVWISTVAAKCRQRLVAALEQDRYAAVEAV